MYVQESEATSSLSAKAAAPLKTIVKTTYFQRRQKIFLINSIAAPADGSLAVGDIIGPGIITPGIAAAFKSPAMLFTFSHDCRLRVIATFVPKFTHSGWPGTSRRVGNRADVGAGV